MASKRHLNKSSQSENCADSQLPLKAAKKAPEAVSSEIEGESPNAESDSFEHVDDNHSPSQLCVDPEQTVEDPRVGPEQSVEDPVVDPEQGFEVPGVDPEQDIEDPVVDPQPLRAVTYSEWNNNRTAYYYHYTTQDRQKSILQDKNIKPGIPFYKRDLGKGVYVTNLDPSTPKDVLREQLFRGGGSPIVSSKLQYFIALNKEDVHRLGFVKEQYRDRDPPRDAYRLTPGDKPIDLTKVRHFAGIN